MGVRPYVIMAKDLGKESTIDLEVEQDTLISKMEQATLLSNMQKDELLYNIERTKVLSDLEETMDVSGQGNIETRDTEPFNYTSNRQSNKGQMEDASPQAG